MFWLKRQLKRLEREANPTPEFKAALWRKLSPAAAPYAHAWRFATVGMTSVALVFGMGTGVYAYSSPDVSEGHPLYFMKQGLEQVEGTFATTPEARAQFHEKMMERRMSEAEHIIDRTGQAADVLQNAANELDMSVSELKVGLRDPSQHQQLIDQLSQNNERYAKLLDRVPGGDAPPHMLPPPERLREHVRMLRMGSQP